LLTPVVLAGGLVAFLSLPLLTLSRRAGRWSKVRERRPLAPVLHLEPAAVEPRFAVARRQAA
jgi:hypothetical protein